MTGLSREARALLERARAQHEPTPRDRESVLRGLGPKLPAAAALASATAHTLSAAASTAPVASATAALVSKWLVGGLLLGALGAGSGTLIERATGDSKPSASPVASARRATKLASAAPLSSAAPTTLGVPMPIDTSEQSSSEASKPVSTGAGPFVPGASGGGNRLSKQQASPPAVVNPAAARTAVAAFPEPPSQNPEGASAMARSRSAPQPTRSADLLVEARALRDAQTALDEGRAAEALALVDAQSKQFANGELQEERRAARLLALCSLGKSRLVEREIAAFLESSSASPLAPRVRKACRSR